MEKTATEKITEKKTASPAAKKAATTKKTTATKPAIKKSALKIIVETPNGYNGTYCCICGNVKELGCWDAAKAVSAEVKNGKAEFSLKIETGSFVEFKVMADKSWTTVQKGGNYEEQQNNWVQVDSDKTMEVKVYHFSTII